MSIVLITKIFVIITIIPYRNWLGWLGNLILAPFQGFPKLELLFVMILYPLIVNILSLWITDNFLKKHHSTTLFLECFEGDDFTESERLIDETTQTELNSDRLKKS